MSMILDQLRPTDANENVKTFVSQALGIVDGFLLIKVAAIGNAADNHKAPLLRPHIKCRGRKNIPHNIAALNICVSAVAFVVGQPELRLDAPS